MLEWCFYPAFFVATQKCHLLKEQLSDTVRGRDFLWTRPLDEALAIRQVRKAQVVEAAVSRAHSVMMVV